MGGGTGSLPRDEEGEGGGKRKRRGAGPGNPHRSRPPGLGENVTLALATVWGLWGLHPPPRLPPGRQGQRKRQVPAPPHSRGNTEALGGGEQGCRCLRSRSRDDDIPTGSAFCGSRGTSSEAGLVQRPQSHVPVSQAARGASQQRGLAPSQALGTQCPLR